MRLSIIVLALLAIAPSQAQTWQIRVETIPRHPKILLESGDGKVTPLPLTGDTVVLKRSELGADGRGQLRLLKPGHLPREIRVTAEELGPPGKVRLPAEPTRFFHLEPIVLSATFHTHPEGASLFLVTPDGPPQHLGISGKPIWLNLATLMGQGEGSYFHLRLERDGYRPATVPVEKHLFRSGLENRWPAQGSYSLQASVPLLGPLWTSLFGSRIRQGVTALIALSVLTVAWPWFRRRQTLLRRARRIEDLVAQPMRTDLLRHQMGPYRLIGKLGVGGTATVYRAVPNESLQAVEQCAVKVLDQAISQSAGFRDRFQQEVKGLLTLSHPSIVRLDDWGEQDGLLYCVLELVEGQTLRSLMQARGMPEELAQPILVQLLQGVQHAHDKEILHRDLKPENLMLSQTGGLKILDFGLAIPLAGATKETSRFGTPGYIAPEQLLYDRTDQYTDQYAIGVIAHELLTGRRPYSQDSDALSRPIPPTGLSSHFDQWVRRMLSKQRGNRFRSLRDAELALTDKAELTV